MNYKVKAFKIVKVGDNTTLEDYEKDVPNYMTATSEVNRLRSMGEYVNISIVKNELESR